MSDAYFSCNIFMIAFTLIAIIMILYYKVILHYIDKNSRLLYENKFLYLKIDSIKSRLSFLENERLRYLNTSRHTKIEHDIETTRKKHIEHIRTVNRLNDYELNDLVVNQEGRWVTIGHSAIGKSHMDASPPVPCQDSHYYNILDDNWVLMVLCDGAGSSLKSDIGASFLAKEAIPKALIPELSFTRWFKSGTLPNGEQWKKLTYKVLNNSYKKLIKFVKEYNLYNESEYNVSDFASTIILTLVNRNGVLIVNIGDGRGGLVTQQGELKPLFMPYKGTESNETVFITSPIWNDPDSFINTNIVNDNVLAAFILSDGLENASFECSRMEDDIFIDANTPYKSFYYPVLSTMKGLPYKDEIHLNKMLIDLLNNGNKVLEDEPDDKSLVLTFLK